MIEVGFLCYTLFNLLTFVICSVDVLAGVPSPGRRRYHCSSGSLDTYFDIYYHRFVGLLRPCSVEMLYLGRTLVVLCVLQCLTSIGYLDSCHTGPTRDDYRVLLNLCGNQ